MNEYKPEADDFERLADYLPEALPERSFVVRRGIFKNRVTLALLIVLLLLALAIAVTTALGGNALRDIDMTRRNQPPSAANIFGTDDLGRDLFTRCFIAAGTSFSVALACVAAQTVLSSVIGGVMGLLGGKTNAVMMTVIAVIESIPYIIIVILLVIATNGGTAGLIIALCATSWCDPARQIRGQVIKLKNSEYAQSSRALGGGVFWVFRKHILPNTVGIVITNAVISIPAFVFMEASLSFLGMGIQDPQISLGTLIYAGQRSMEIYPHELLFPVAILVVAALAFNILGDRLSVMLNPRLSPNTDSK